MIQERFFPGIPNCAFRKLVINYAFFAGRPVFTLRQQHGSLIEYLKIAKKLN